MGREKDIVLSFSERLRSLRKEYNITQEQLAERSDVSYKNIQYLESKNPTCPNLRTLYKLAKGFDMSLAVFLNFK